MNLGTKHKQTHRHMKENKFRVTKGKREVERGKSEVWD